MIPYKIIVTPVAEEDLRRYMAYLSKAKKESTGSKECIAGFQGD